MTRSKKIITILLACILICGCFSACGAYKEHSTKYKKAVGTWILDSILVNTHPIKINGGSLNLNSDGTGTLEIITTEITDNDKVDSDNVEWDGTSTTMSYVTETIYFTSKSEGILTGTSEEHGTMEYEFNVDTEGKIIHIYARYGDDLYHYICYQEMDD